MRKCQYLFGPVPSRRLGRSLGVDLTPYKTCNHDCVFCQLGRTQSKTVTRKEYAPIEKVLTEIQIWLQSGGKADHITLSGSGEPTLHSCFDEVFRFVRKKSFIKTVLLTNGSLFHLPEVRKAASCADLVKLTLSAWNSLSYGWVNRPHPDLDFNQVIEGQKAFRKDFKGELWIEVFIVPGMNSIPCDVSKIAALAATLQPNRIHLNTAVRPPAEDFVTPLRRESLSSLSHLFHPPADLIADFKSDAGLDIQGNEEAILSMLKRRSSTAEDIGHAFGMHSNEVSKYLGTLLRHGNIHAERNNGSFYYIAASNGVLDPRLR